jgi:endonuclease I
MKQFLTISYLFVMSTFLVLSQPINPSLQKNADFNDSLYYAPAFKLYGTALRAALHDIIKGHTSVGYSGLLTSFPMTDLKPNGTVWDIYSDIPGGTPAYEYIYGSKQCGNYSKEGDCYNREHSMPDSWLGTSEPARSDLYHMYPTDGYVNNRRSNYPFGPVNVPTWTSTNGSKVGPSMYPGYTGIVFEPINAYKGDLARSTFYLSVRYYLEDASWSTSPATNKSDILPWYSAMMYEWHMNDSVSLKEINRIAAIYTIQHNRNPFIDHPEFVAEIWKTDMPPAVISLTNTNATTTVIDFSRYLDSTQAVNRANFVFDGNIGNPATIQWGDSFDVSKIILTTSAFASNTNYSIQIKNQKSINGIIMNDTTISFHSGSWTRVNEARSLPSKFVLEQNYPNPFNPATIIKYYLPAAGFVNLRVFDLLGREVAALVHSYQFAGVHTVQFRIDNTKFSIPSGLYFYQLTIGQFSETRLMVLLK